MLFLHNVLIEKEKTCPGCDNAQKGDGKTGKSFSGLCHHC